jgi:hypothetical protein
MPKKITLICVPRDIVIRNIFSDTAHPSMNYNSRFFTKDAEEVPEGSSTPIKMHKLFIYKYTIKDMNRNTNGMQELIDNSEDISNYILEMPKNNYTITDTSNNSINIPFSSVQKDDKNGFYVVSYKDTEYQSNLSDVFIPGNQYIFTFGVSKPVQSQSSRSQPAQVESSQNANKEPAQSKSEPAKSNSQAESDDEEFTFLAGGGLIFLMCCICCISIIIGGIIFFIYKSKKPSKRGGYFILND